MESEHEDLNRLIYRLWIELQDYKAELALKRRYRELKANYNPNQPRLPRGHEDGGQWVAAGGHLDGETERDLRDYLRLHTPKPMSGLQSYMGTKPDFFPSDVDIDENLQISEWQKFNSLWYRAVWFYNQVRNKGPWDYKQKARVYEDFGNFHYGAVGRAAGFSEETLLRAAGWAQVRDGNSQADFGVRTNVINVLIGVGGASPYGDDPKDQYWIKRGFLYYEHWKRDLKRRR